MITIDFETRSKCIIQDTGHHRYAEDPSTEVLCMAYAVDNGPIEIWHPGEDFPLKFKSLPIEAHNSGFERAIWRNIMVKQHGWPDIPDDQWRCSASVACYRALPRALDRVGAALGLKTVKSTYGKRVMTKLSRPAAPIKNDPTRLWHNEKADYEALYEYCKDDVAAERAVHDRLGELPPGELAIWQLDQKINERGIRVDMPAVRAAIKLLDEQEGRLKAEFKALTGIESPTLIAQFKKWLEVWTYKTDSLDKNATATLINEIKSKPFVTDVGVKVLRALEIRQQLGKTSTAKYKAISDSVCHDDRLRGLLMYHGASTGRWTGALVQPQNFPKNTYKGDLNKYFDFLKTADLDTFSMVYPVNQTLSETIRGVFIPSENHVFVGGDYNAIEARVLFWLAGESRGLQMFRENADIYKDLATTIYDVPVDKVTKEQRDLGKRGVLGCGYGMGHVKFRQTCMDFARVEISEELAEKVITAYRTKYRTVVVLWQLQELAAKQAVETKKPVRCGKTIWGVHDGFLFCRLPSGRSLAYYDPKIEMVETSWGEKKAAVTYMGVNSTTKEWERQSTYGGKIVENITQAVARDLMASAMLNCEKEGFKVVLSVHDELLTEIQAPTHRWDAAKYLFEKVMTTLPDWAVGLPVRAEGWTGMRYSK